MRTACALLISFLVLAQCGAQETQTEPQPVIPPAPVQTAPQSQQTGSQPAGTQKAAPVERRASKPNPNSTEPVSGPLT